MDSCGFVEQGRSWIDSSKFCSYGDLYEWGRKSVRKSLLLLIIPKSIAGRHSPSVLANSETTQPLDHFSPLLLGICVLRGPWPLHNERMSKRLAGKMWFFPPFLFFFLLFSMKHDSASHGGLIHPWSLRMGLVPFAPERFPPLAGIQQTVVTLNFT